MQRILLLFLLVGTLTARTLAQENVPGSSVEAIVTMHIDDLTEAQWARLVARVGQEHTMNVEYNCLQTCVVVLRMQQLQVAEKADVIQVVKHLLKEAQVPGAVKFLDVHVEQQGGNKC